MIPERYRELLTAYVDGELSARQRRALQKLLRRSPEARALLRKMEADSRELRALPPQRLGQDLSDSVLTLIAERQIPAPRPRVTPPPPLPAAAGSLWPHFAAAAAILLAVSVGSYLFFATTFDPPRTGPIVKDDPKRPAKDDTKEPDEAPKDQTSNKAKEQSLRNPTEKPELLPIVKDRPNP